MNLYLVGYAPSSPYRLIDLAKVAYSFNFVKGFIVIKPVGLAAQSGLPEVFKIAYKHNKPLFILSNLSELKDVLSIEKLIFLIQSCKEAPDIEDLVKTLNAKSLAIIVQAGETPLTKEDITLGNVAKISELSEIFSPSAVAEATAALLKLSKFFTVNTTE